MELSNFNVTWTSFNLTLDNSYLPVLLSKNFSLSYKLFIFLLELLIDFMQLGTLLIFLYFNSSCFDSFKFLIQSGFLLATVFLQCYLSLRKSSFFFNQSANDDNFILFNTWVCNLSFSLLSLSIYNLQLFQVLLLFILKLFYFSLKGLDQFC